jgi:hypothetical protein
VRPFGIFFFHRRDPRHAAVIRFSTQPPKECPLQEFGIQPIGLRPSMLARHGDTRRVDDIPLDITCSKPAGQPEAITASLEGDRDALDLAARSDCIALPSLQEPQQLVFVGH